MKSGELRQFHDVTATTTPENHWVSGRCFMIVGFSSLDAPLPVYKDHNTIVSFLVEGGDLVRGWGYEWIRNNSEVISEVGCC